MLFRSRKGYGNDIVIVDASVIIDLTQSIIIITRHRIGMQEAVFLRDIGGTLAQHTAQFSKLHPIYGMLYRHVIVIKLRLGAPMELNAGGCLLAGEVSEFDGVDFGDSNNNTAVGSRGSCNCSKKGPGPAPAATRSNSNTGKKGG